jgi:hypothetical protein
LERKNKQGSPWETQLVGDGTAKKREGNSGFGLIGVKAVAAAMAAARARWRLLALHLALFLAAGSAPAVAAGKPPIPKAISVSLNRNFPLSLSISRFTIRFVLCMICSDWARIGYDAGGRRT